MKPRTLLGDYKRPAPTRLARVKEVAQNAPGVVGALKAPPHHPGFSADGKNKQNTAEPTSLGDVVAAAKNLSPIERRELLAELALDNQLASKGAGRDLEMWSGAVSEALEDAIGRSGVSAAGPLVVRRLLSAPSAWSPVEEFMVRSKMQELTVSERNSVYLLLARLLVARCREIGRHTSAPLTPKFVAGQAPTIGAVFDAAFPGYAQAGLARFVAKRLTMRRAG